MSEGYGSRFDAKCDRRAEAAAAVPQAVSLKIGETVGWEEKNEDGELVTCSGSVVSHDADIVAIQPHNWWGGEQCDSRLIFKALKDLQRFQAGSST